jgi:NAD(P)-dependent dehydrogenase (short-subunit alcohol dehydrogenase family)
MPKSDYSPPTEKTHFLVSGGGKGITAANAVALARAYHSRFSLLGRSELLSQEPVWAEGFADEAALKGAALDNFQSQGKKATPREIGRKVDQVMASREIYDTLEQIKGAGGQAEYIQVDITSSADLKKQLGGSLKDITGLLHGAGALADKYIEDKSEADFDLVYGVKVGGLKNLLELIPPDQLDFLILFSSVAGYYGNAGQADYSLSNEILNKLAHFLKNSYPRCQVLSFGWGPWDGGMVTPQLKRILTRKNVPLISLESGTQALVDLLGKPQENSQHIIGNSLPFPPRKLASELKDYRLLRRLSLAKNPFLADHVIGGKAVLPTVCAVAWFINACEALHPGFKYLAVRDYQVFKGIVFEDSSPDEYLLELREVEKSSEGLLLEGKISSESPTGKNRFHYQARVELKKTLPDRPRITDFNLDETSPITGESLYGNKILFHGPRFQGVDRVLNISPTGLTTRCLLPWFPAQEMGQFPVRTINPYLADVHLQSLLIWAHSQKGSLGLPLQIAGGVHYAQVPFGAVSYSTMKVKNTTAHKLVADVISHDEEGLVFSEVIDAEITLNEKLYELFQDNQLENEPIWT